MISKKDLLIRIKKLEKKLLDAKGNKPKPVTLSVPIVDESGDRIRGWISMPYSGGYVGQMYKDISFEEVCKALQDMCDIEIAYQKIEGKSGVVIYEKGDDSVLEGQ